MVKSKFVEGDLVVIKALPLSIGKNYTYLIGSSCKIVTVKGGILPIVIEDKKSGLTWNFGEKNLISIHNNEFQTFKKGDKYEVVGNSDYGIVHGFSFSETVTVTKKHSDKIECENKFFSQAVSKQHLRKINK